MGKLIRIAIALAVMVVLLAPTTAAFATANKKLRIFQDVSDGGTEPRDTAGPGIYGFANTSQDGITNDLRVVGVLKGVAPNTTYQVTIWCGPTHATPGNALYVGTITTNPKGNANTGAIIIPGASLSTCGASGYSGTAHMDFDNLSTSGTYVSRGIPYIVP